MVADGSYHRGNDRCFWHLGLIPEVKHRRENSKPTILRQQAWARASREIQSKLLSVTSFVPREIVGDHSSSNGHLLEGQNELADPDETHNVVPHQELKRSLHFILNHAGGVVFYWRSWEGKPARVSVEAAALTAGPITTAYLTLGSDWLIIININLNKRVKKVPFIYFMLI